MNIDMKAAKIEFYEKIKPYFDAGLVREIYNSDHLCILSVGERVYVACPFVFLEDEPSQDEARDEKKSVPTDGERSETEYLRIHAPVYC